MQPAQPLLHGRSAGLWDVQLLAEQRPLLAGEEDALGVALEVQQGQGRPAHIGEVRHVRHQV